MSMPRRRSVATPLRSGTPRLTLREERPYATPQNAHAPRHRCAQPPDHGVGHAHGQDYASPLTSRAGDLAVTTEYKRPAATIAAGWEEYRWNIQSSWWWPSLAAAGGAVLGVLLRSVWASQSMKAAAGRRPPHRGRGAGAPEGTDPRSEGREAAPPARGRGRGTSTTRRARRARAAAAPARRTARPALRHARGA